MKPDDRRISVLAVRRFVLGDLVAEPGQVVEIRERDLRAIVRSGLGELYRDRRDRPHQDDA